MKNQLLDRFLIYSVLPYLVWSGQLNGCLRYFCCLVLKMWIKFVYHPPCNYFANQEGHVTGIANIYIWTLQYTYVFLDHDCDYEHITVFSKQLKYTSLLVDEATGHKSNLYIKWDEEMKWNESGFRPLLCTYRLNWTRRTSWGWWNEWDDTALQTQDSKFVPWRSEAEHTASRSRRLPTILSFTSGWRRNIFVSFKPPRPGNEPRALAWKAAVLTTTLGPPPKWDEDLIWNRWCRQRMSIRSICGKSFWKPFHLQLCDCAYCFYHSPTCFWMSIKWMCFFFRFFSINTMVHEFDIGVCAPITKTCNYDRTLHFLLHFFKYTSLL